MVGSLATVIKLIGLAIFLLFEVALLTIRANKLNKSPRVSMDDYD